MLVRDLMQSNVVTAAADTPLSTAASLMSQFRIRHLPVVAGDRLLGLISDRDLKASVASLAVGHQRPDPGAPGRALTAGDLMRPTVVTVGSTTPPEDAARLLAEYRIGSLPVVDDGRFVGIVTDTDLLAFFARVVVGREPSARLEIVVPPRGPSLIEIIQVLENFGGRLVSLLVCSEPDRPNQLVVRLTTSDPGPMVAALRAADYTVRQTPVWGGKPARDDVVKPGGPFDSGRTP